MTLLYEINTRCWLRALSDKRGAAVTLTDVPDSVFAQWRTLGFSHIWLMGVWTTGPRARAEALQPDLRRAYDAVLPGWTTADVPGSPYSISDYQVPPALGGEAGLRTFREKLQQHGLKLVLDFVPNHLGLDHAWIGARPELFVQSRTQVPGTFAQETPAGLRWLAHGKDPYFPPWTDVAQLDYRRAATRAAMTELLQSVASRCDGVRCDMAMLLLNDVFARTWERFSIPGHQTPRHEFWPAAISAVKQAHPEFHFLAEAYWGLEARLQGLGFDTTYDKTLYDELMARNGAGVQRHLLSMTAESLAATAHFLENHDEPRVASGLSFEEHRAAALVILGLPGMRFLHDGQLAGARVKVPVQLGRAPEEAVQPEVAGIYQEMLATLPRTAVGRGKAELLRPRAAWHGNSSAQHFVIVQWHSQAPGFDLVVANLAPHRSQCYAPLSVPGLREHDWSMKDLLGAEEYQRAGKDLHKQGLYLDLPPHGAQLFHFRPTA